MVAGSDTTKSSARVRDPLRRRFWRELKGDPGKYLVIFLLMLFSIAEISGFLVADESMIAAYSESFEKYNIEDGNFTVQKELSARQRQAIEALGTSIYDLQFTDRPISSGDTLRIFAMRDEVDLVCLMRGAFPEGSGEIAIDRMYADNNGISIGDVITVEGGRNYTVTGFVALSDYSAMFENNSDMMFDAKTFGVAVVSKEAFSAIDQDLWVWRYAWKYDKSPADDTEANAMSDEFLKGLVSIVSLEDYIPRYQNQAITFTGEDMGSDRAMMMILLYIIIAIIAFVFGVTISNTIASESCVIGTLRATGYTRGELVRHYMTLPLIVTAAAAAAGNVLGYTVMKDLNAGLYYGSYSLPAYVTRWSPSAFFETTVVPMLLMAVISWWTLTKKLRLSPLKFLRRDLRKSRSRGAVPLSSRIPFFTRFRLRIFFQNMGSYLVLLVGIAFANFLLMFGLGLPDVLQNYVYDLQHGMICNYQYILELPASVAGGDSKLESFVNMALFRQAVETENQDAEAFSAYAMKTLPAKGFKGDDISVYGVREDSRYVDIDAEGNEVYVSQVYADKWELKAGDDLELGEAYSDKVYSFKIAGIYPYEGALCIFMDQEALNSLLELPEGTFSGYFSNSPIEDIDERYIGQVVDIDALSKISRQLNISFGTMMHIVEVFSMMVYMIMIYLLSKTIIEKNASSISMTKILGYTNAELARLYVLITSILVVIFLIITIPSEVGLLTTIFRIMVRQEMKGWIPFELSNKVFVKMMIYGLVTYAAVAALEYRKISRVPMEEALKNVE